MSPQQMQSIQNFTITKTSIDLEINLRKNAHLENICDEMFICQQTDYNSNSNHLRPSRLGSNQQPHNCQFNILLLHYQAI